jgi:hypothetical protein
MDDEISMSQAKNKDFNNQLVVTKHSYCDIDLINIEDQKNVEKLEINTLNKIYFYENDHPKPVYDENNIEKDNIE